MAERPIIDWAGGNPSGVIEPSAGKKALGWTPGEKPPAEYFNWHVRELGLSYDYVNARVKNSEPVIIRSGGSVTWSGSQISFASNLQIIFRKDTGAQINQIQSGASPISLADGEVLVVRRDYFGGSPVNLASGSYGSLVDGEYAILAESSLTGVDIENEMILFRRRGSDLEIPYMGIIVSSGGSVNNGSISITAADVPITDVGGYFSSTDVEGALQELGAAVVSSSSLPIGSIIAFYDYNGALTFDNTTWAYCDGTNKTFAGIGVQATPDLSGRYLVGFGTDGGGDIDTAAWATAAVGNAGHTINLQHSHSVNAHSHTPGTLKLQWGQWNGTNAVSRYGKIVAGGLVTVTQIAQFDPADAGSGQYIFDDSAAGPNTYWIAQGDGAYSAGTTGTDSPGTNLQLSTTQSIQPRSIRVRYLIRYN